MDECCGFSSLEYPSTLKTNLPIIKNKIKNIEDSKVDYVLTTCVGCLLNISIMGLFKNKTRRLLSFLKNNCSFK